MGNCIDLQKAVTWVDDEDASVERQMMDEARVTLLARSDREKEAGSAGLSTEIKIKISKKQMEELLRRVNGERVPLRQALAELVSSHGAESWGVGPSQEAEGGHWRPELQSIPEVPE